MTLLIALAIGALLLFPLVLLLHQNRIVLAPVLLLVDMVVVLAWWMVVVPLLAYWFIRRWSRSLLRRVDSTQIQQTYGPETVVPVVPHLSLAVLEIRYHRAKDPQRRVWWLVIWLAMQGESAERIAAHVGISVDAVRVLVDAYNTCGPSIFRVRGAGRVKGNR